MTQVISTHLGESLGTDFFSVREQFTDEQWEHFIAVRRFVDEEVVPVVGPYWERAEICWPLVRRLPELGIVGEDIKGYGCAGMSPMACGLVTMELHRGDGSLGVFLGVHAGLAMLSIAMCGSEEQKARWLPDMARMDKLGAFTLTEPDHGSDSVAFETSARPDGDGWVLNGAKRWIGPGTMADLIVVWACSTEDGQVNGFVVEKGSPGLQASVIEGKVSLRAVWQADITLDNVRVPAENRLPGARTTRSCGTWWTWRRSIPSRHRDHADAHRRPRHHRHRGLHVACSPSRTLSDVVSEEVGLRLGAGLVGAPVEVGNAFAGQHVLARERLPRAVAARLGDHRVCRVRVQFGPARLAIASTRVRRRLWPRRRNAAGRS